MAERFNGYDEHLIFEGMNESRMKDTPQEWMGENAEASQSNVGKVLSTKGSREKNSLHIVGQRSLYWIRRIIWVVGPQKRNGYYPEIIEGLMNGLK